MSEEVESLEEGGDIPKKLVKVYVKIRDKRRALAEEDKELERQLETIGIELLEIMRTMGVESMRTEFGTVSRRTNTRFTTNDWHSFHQFVKEHDALNLIENRISQGNMGQFLEEHPDLHPPGLNVDRKYTAVITKR